MADETIESLVQWGVDNQHLKGTPEFEAKTQQYKALRDATAPAAAPEESPLNPANARSALADKFGSFVKTAGEDTAANPGGVSATTGRIITGAATGVPDLGIGIYNAGARATGNEGSQVDFVGPQINQALGGAPLPEGAGTARQLLEAGGSALLGGGASAVARTIAAAPSLARAAIPAVSKLFSTTIAPTLGSHFGGQGGEAAARSLGIDPETGALIGSLLGGVAPGAGGAAGSKFTDWRYRDMGRPNAPEIAAAAARENIRLPASALGNDTIRLRENSYANRLGASDFTNNIRMGARDQTGAAWDDMSTARGALDPNPSRGSLGTDAGDIAGRGAAEGNRIVSARQDYLQQRAAPTGDIAALLDEMRRVANSTDAITARPIEARIAALESRLPRDPETGAITSYETPYQHIKDSRTGTRVASEGVGGVPGRYAGQVEDAHTQFMRDAAENPAVFDRIQQFTARMKGTNDITGEQGPIPRLEALNQQVTNNPETGYNFLKRGEQNPENLRLLQQTQQPDVNTLLGDYLRRMGNETINNPNQGAPGPRQLATRVENMNEQSRPLLFGPQEQRATDIAMLARALNAPTRQGGLGQTMGNINAGIPAALTAGEVGASIGGATGVPYGATTGRAVGYGIGPLRRAIGGRLMQGDTAMNALAGGPRQGNYQISDLVAAINAASIPQKQGM